MSSKRVQYNEDTDLSENKKYIYFKRVRTPHAKKSINDGDEMIIRIPAHEAQQYQTSKKVKASRIAKKVSSRRSVKERRSTPHPRGKYGVDGRSTDSARRRKSEAAKRRPRGSDGRFKKTPKRQQRKSRGDESGDESFLDTTMPEMPYSKLIQSIFQTPEFKKAVRQAVSQKREQESDGEESFLGGTFPTLPESKLVQMIFQTPGAMKAIKKTLRENSTPQRLNFDESDDE
jgi:hypothetical protein